MRVIIAEFHDYSAGGRLQVIEDDDWPDRVDLYIIGPKGGFGGQVSLPKATARKLGDELRQLT